MMPGAVAAAMARQAEGRYAPVSEVSLASPWEDAKYGWRFRCETCEVLWHQAAPVKPAVAEAEPCWLCGKLDDVQVWTYGGKPWTFPLTPDKGALL